MASRKVDLERYVFAESLFGLCIDTHLAGIRDRIIAEGSLKNLSARQIRMPDDAWMRTNSHEWIDEKEWEIYLYFQEERSESVKQADIEL